MKTALILLLSGFFTGMSFAQIQFGEPFTDTRDGQVYNTVTIGSQTWLDRNINFNTPGSWCYNNRQELCDQDGYGRLYNWASAQNACPPGTHIPTIREWGQLSQVIDPNGDPDKIGVAVKAQTSWGFNANDGRDQFGLRIQPVGMRDGQGQFMGWGSETTFWLPGEDGGEVKGLKIYKTNSTDLMRGSTKPKEAGFSVRCVKN